MCEDDDNNVEKCEMIQCQTTLTDKRWSKLCFLAWNKLEYVQLLLKSGMYKYTYDTVLDIQPSLNMHINLSQ